MVEQQPSERSTGPSSESSEGETPPDAAGDGAGDAEWRRRRRLAEVFGDVLPETTSDERDPVTASDATDSAEETPQDRWLRSQVPPHHG
jgi:hypothetical protein